MGKIYIDDKGLRHRLEVMETSHLINVIRHHYDQWSSLEGPIDAHAEALCDVIEILSAELAKRKPRTYIIDEEKISIAELLMKKEDMGSDPDYVGADPARDDEMDPF